MYKFVVLVFILVVAAATGERRECPASFNCGDNIGNFSFPLTTAERQECGLLAINNCYEPAQVDRWVQLSDEGKTFLVIRVSQQNFTSIQFRDKDLYDLLQSRNCNAFRYNYTLSTPPTFHHFASLYMEYNTTLYTCNRTLHFPPTRNMFSYANCTGIDIYYGLFMRTPQIQSSLASCTKVLLPIKDVPDGNDPFTFVNADINAKVILSQECTDCHYKQRGQCQLDSKSKFCCANVRHTENTSTSSRSWVVMNMRLALGLALSIVAALLLLSVCCLRRKLFTLTICCFWNKTRSTGEIIIESFLKQHGSLPTRRYKYSEIKKFTDDFKVKLGRGGYGTVYKGKLQDGSLIAVKVLSEVKGTAEEFINEVASISRTSHVNIVSLVGFCFQGSKRALIYEFMPNGSLEKFICEENSTTVGHQLDSRSLYDIAVGVARGLNYLHRGCNTRILHFDIKPHNILLDKDFCPKISDFGLAKICPRKESIVSMSCARGTIGFIAPELFSRNFGGISHKADVYSYGMMVLEMVGGRNNKNVEVDRSSELYFPHWIYKRLELDEELGLRCIKKESDREIVRKMTLVSLWCIQTNPLYRPSMSKVVEMLEGSLESFELPPRPFFSSSPTSPINYSSHTSESL
ncbi:LEAF RUST 10 DISEASE-RESISTANCE LOCUS RECEPTOR-LIKE PROTEIN KINASE-like 2.1 isoform X2 [Arachis ipaensis]|uniref:LEAF RUST 10 DISEASE-RESISTANCE LOCUS RECEPTOR-LIKE PROTEIN KINASE-like 2.1 isoform X2 n=1 Tax=Arachis ipaensis TaxID=130454 RepID=UPI0007AF6EBB|nr:LEAF RUST 10 DISEASE-RESISTANCE LOCUS RECEPTOR-LIKE PROTEIN KINASE-like 2.1 isoform X2 [Arachis ipaensis]